MTYAPNGRAATPGPDDPSAREAQTFPRLRDEMIARARRHGREEALPPGATAFARGDRSVDFLIVLDGAIDGLGEREDGSEALVARHGPGIATGETDLFSDREILVTGRATQGARVIRVPQPASCALLMGEPDVGEIVMRASILRRVVPIRRGQGGVVLVEPRRASSGS